jgi:hypothetical protein
MRLLLLLLFAAAACTSAAENPDRKAAPSGQAAGATPIDSARPASAAAGARRSTASTNTGDRRRAAPARSSSTSAGQLEERGPAVVRALYVNRWASQSRRRMVKLIATADSTEINALVVDMKDEFGLNFATSKPEFAKNAGGANKIRNVAAFLDTLRAHKIFPIARIVVFKDSVTARVHPEWTIRRTDGSIWRDKKGIAWVNPYHRELWEYNIGVAEELVKMGFGEVQFDYIRFPEPYPSLPKQVFPGGGDLSKPDALAAYLKEAKERLNKLGVRSTADIFGLVTTVDGALEVGQEWEKISPNVDVALPMVYPSHYPRGELHIPHPNAEPYKVIVTAISRARERDKKLGLAEPEHVRPWLQAFTLGPPEYGAPQLEAEKKAVYDSGYRGWVMWNPGSIYDVFVPALERKKAQTALRGTQG